MFVEPIIPASHPIPARTVVRTVYATAINPYSQQPQRVRVQAIRICRNILWHRFKVADVIGLTATQGYSVAPDTLKNISFFVTLEVY